MKHPTVLLLAITVLPGCAPTPEPASQPTPVYARPAASLAVAATRTYSATIKPKTSVSTAFRVNGYVDALLPGTEEGDRVEKGQLLASLRLAEFDARVDRCSGDVEQAKAAALTAAEQHREALAADRENERNYRRYKALHLTGACSRATYEATETRLAESRARVSGTRSNVSAAQARVRAANAALAEARIDRDDTRLLAPITGIVMNRSIERGSFVSAGETGFVIADMSRVKAVCAVPDLDLSELALGRAVAVTGEALPGFRASGRVAIVSPVADARSRAFEVEIGLENPELKLRNGMIVAVHPESGDAAKRVAVLLASIVADPARPHGFGIFIVNGPEHSAHAGLRRVSLGETVGDYVTVVEGASAGDLVVTRGAALLADGDAVRVIPAAE
jgi:RND family efflux transporter MFP subunit